MQKFPLFILFCSIVILIGCAEDSSPTADDFRGNIISAEMWDEILQSGVLKADGSPYLAVDTLRIPAGAELTIQSGVELRFDIGIPFEVSGKITAIGTEYAPITFTSGLTIPDRGDWDGIWLDNADYDCEFRYCYFLYGAKYGRRSNYTTVGSQIDSSLWEYGSLTLIGSSPLVSHCWFIAGGFHGVHCEDDANPIIQHNIFYENAGHGIYVNEDSNPEIKYNIIIENDDYGLFCKEESNQPRPDIQLWYNIVWSNFSGEFNLLAPSSLGRIATVNGNLDSCDYHYNLRLNPAFKDLSSHNIKEYDFHLEAWSAAIDAGPEDLTVKDPDGTRTELGIYPYEYRRGEIRRILKLEELTTDVSPYIISSDILLPRGSSLTIEPGVEILIEYSEKADGRFKFRVMGSLYSEGTEDNPISFRSAKDDPDKGDWLGLIFDTVDDEDVVIRYTNISHAHFGIMLTSRNAIIDHCIIEQCDSVGVFCDDYSEPEITNSIIRDNSVAGILCRYNSAPLIDHNLIINGSGYGIEAKEHSMPIITYNVITGVATSGIRLENLSNAVVINNTIALNGYYGMYCENNSSPDVRNNIFFRNGSERLGGIGLKAESTSLPSIEYNCFWDHFKSSVEVSLDTTMSATNLIEAPLFVNADEGNFHLQANSRCLVGGDSNYDSQIGALGQ
ncbi:MAG: right-handed parallel beta-helix repeat-containing protein [Calditrichaeota bacterium]|nr:right-handed parallel beta-helix repeat-containing protein [Calditrichota bacterium]